MCSNAASALLDAPAPVDADQAAFQSRLLDTLNAAGTGLMLSVGHRCGLFGAMADGTPRTSAELAAGAGLDERYVREWLAAMSTAGIVSRNADGRCALPPANAALLGEGGFAGMFQWIAVLGGVESQVVDCFHHGGGVPYAAFRRFHATMAEESALTTVAALDAIIALVPGLGGRLAAGMDVADIGCGEGRALLALARRYPFSRFTGVDFSPEAIAAATAQAARDDLANITFIEADAAALTGSARFDWIATFDAIHDQADPAAVLANIRRLLRPGGVYLMQDIDARSDVAANRDHPLGPWLYTISTMHCMTVSLADGGAGLGTAWGEELALEMLAQAGFGPVDTRRLPHDMQNLYYICR